MPKANTDTIRDALRMLYSRIDSPLMRYRNARDESLAILDEIDEQLEGEGSEGENPLDETSTIDDVKALVEDGTVSAEQALEWEKANKDRVTLIEWLEGRLEDEDEA